MNKTNKLKKDLLVTIADKNYVNQAKQLISSVYHNSGWEGDYMLLTSGLSDDLKKGFESKGVIVYDRPYIQSEPVGRKKYPPIILSKLYLFQAEFKKWRKIIFLDSDMIVNTSLNELLNYKGLSFTKATTFKLKDEFYGDKKMLKELSLKYNFKSKAFSSAVIVIDTESLSEDTFRDLIKLLAKHNNICDYGEESVLNMYYYNNWNEIPFVYNLSPNRMKYFLVLRRVISLRPYIILYVVCQNLGRRVHIITTLGDNI